MGISTIKHNFGQDETETLNAEMLRLLKVSLRTIICASTTYRWHQSIIIVKGRNPTIFIFKSIFFNSKKCGEKELPCHRLILTARSPVFKSMFSCKTFSESQNGEVIIDDISYSNFNLKQKISKEPDMQKFKQKFTNYAVYIEDIYTKLNIRDIHFD
jgi:hypothetical protein